MAKEAVEKRTVIVIPEDSEELAVVSTFNRKWLNRMDKLVADGNAEEIESSVEGAREFEFDRSMLKMPFVRTPRVWTEEQREEARERLAAVRAAVLKTRPKKAKKAVAKTPPAPAKAVVTKGKPAKKAAKPVEPEVEEEYEEEEEEFEEEEEELEEVVVKKSSKPAAKPAKKVAKKH